MNNGLRMPSEAMEGNTSLWVREEAAVRVTGPSLLQWDLQSRAEPEWRTVEDVIRALSDWALVTGLYEGAHGRESPEGSGLPPQWRDTWLPPSFPI